MDKIQPPKVINNINVVTKIGGSYYLLLDKKTRHLLALEEGSVVRSKIWLVNTKLVNCPKCKKSFEDYVDNDPHDCPLCGDEFIDINTNTVEKEVK